MQEVTDPKFISQLACLGAWSFTVESFLPPMLDSPGIKSSGSEEGCGQLTPPWWRNRVQ